ncbi:MAG: hypothetical protein EA379_04650 [Phycisphaerales bacterium]|nr:MAG: hypothetical protein EA379_04650 [Phycisphaerales bacterium]
MQDRPITVAHVTHEAIDQLGGIGTVLEGLITSPVYQRAVDRSILIGPLHDWSPSGDALARLGPHGTRVRYSGPDGLDPEGLGAVLRPIELAFNTPMVLGVREYVNHLQGGTRGEAEVLLIDITATDKRRLQEFKHLLFTRFGLECHRYENDWGFEEYCRLALPAWHALMALIPPNRFPAVLISHEFMGMCTALHAAADPHRRLRTVFHAHECSTARAIVESHPGHDTAFYPAMRRAMKRGLHVQGVFGDQSNNPRHALISRAHRLDATLAVGDETANEMRFLSPEMQRANVRVCYNGVPSAPIDDAAQRDSRRRVDEWAERALGFRPDYLLTHVTRPVISKGLWRDLAVCANMERALRDEGKRALYLLLTCGARPRSLEDVRSMRERYGWPDDHHEGYPDVTGPETEPWRMIQVYNNPGRIGSGAVHAVLVNQFGFSPETLGDDAPEGLSTTDLRRAADVEFGMSVYEPFGIAQLEPLHAGAICVPSSVCGCTGFALRGLAEMGIEQSAYAPMLVGDYTTLDHASHETMSQAERDAHELEVSRDIATSLLQRLPRSAKERAALREQGGALAARMGWDRVCEEMFLPALREILR